MMVQYQRILLFLLLFLSCFLSARCKNKKMRLQGEDAIDKKAMDHNRDECSFGKEFYEIGTKWHPDLGEPFGVYHCVTCECVQEKRKRKMIGRTRCKSTECPDVTCNTEPIKIAGQCCKICPSNSSSNAESMLKDIPLQTGDTEENPASRHFFLVLTSQMAGNIHKTPPLESMNLAATARFELHNRHLYFSIYANRRPKNIQFLLHNGDIIEEQTFLSNSFYEQETGKTCGVWRRLSKESKRLLREERIYVTLEWEEGQFMSGQLKRHKTIITEQFSSLLHNENYSIIGTTFIALSTTTPTMPSVHLTVLFSSPPISFTAQKDIFINIKLEETHNHSSIINEIVKLEKWQDINTLEVSGVTSSDLLNKLTKQTYHSLVTVTILGSTPSPTTEQRSLQIKGRVIPKVRCEMLQAILTYNTRVTDVVMEPIMTGAHGLAWMFFDSTNSLRYFVHLDHTEADSITLARVNKDKLISLEDISTQRITKDSINGSVYVGYHLMEILNSGSLILNVAKSSNPSLIRGILKSKLVADASLAPTPWLLDYKDVTSADVGGLIWVSFDQQCDLHYEVHMTGLKQKIDIDFYMKEAPMNPIISRAPITKNNVRHFFSSIGFEGIIRDVSNDLMYKLNSGVVAFEIVDSTHEKTILKTKWNKIVVPPQCLPNTISPEFTLSNDDNTLSSQSSRCYHGGIFYKDGDVWSSTEDQCTMCNCQNGHTVCDVIVCPPIKCNKHPIQREGECCPVCPKESSDGSRERDKDLNSTRGCILRDQFHRAGSSWYPYIPPNGFDICTTCSCSSSNLTVKCARTECPRLPCADSEAKRIEKFCCKVCPETSTRKPSSNSSLDLQPMMGIQKDEGNKLKYKISISEILTSGGCRDSMGGIVENGYQYHPKSLSVVFKCIICTCKDGTIICSTKRCHKDDTGPCCDRQRTRN